MSNRKRFFLNGILLALVGLLIRGVTLALNGYLSRAIGEEGIGLFTLIGTVYGFAVTFASAGISLTVTRLVSSAIGEGRDSEVRSVMRGAVFYSLLFGTMSTAALYFGASYFGGVVLADSRCVLPLKILSASLIPIAMSAVISGYFIGVKRVFNNALVQVFGQIFRILMTVLLVSKSATLGVERGVFALAFGMSVTEIAVFLVALVGFIIDKRRKMPRESKRENKLLPVFSMALPLAVSAYIRSALLTLEHVLIPKRLKDAGATHGDAVSAYGTLHGMALPLLLYPMSPLSSFAGLLVPEFSEGLARGELSRLQRIASEAINTTLAYAIAASLLMLVFSEELGYVVYGSSDAGRYIAVMAPVVPIMYLDHTTDAMLKGIGEQVYSMWVNITDAILSIILVIVLIPKLGILGYAVVIVVMEGYNFTLSALRLYKRIKFRVSPLLAVVFPIISAIFSAYLSRRIFVRAGVNTSAVWLTLEIVFAASAFIGVYLTLKTLCSLIKRKRKLEY